MTHLPRIRANGHMLATEDGAPFFWLGDTAWELFHRLTREEAARYFANRQARRFNVIQAVVLAELDGLNTPNRYGERPLIDNDPTRPNAAYFAYVDEIVQLAADHDLYIGLLPTWGDKVNEGMWGVGPIVFDVENARIFGRYLGERYRDQSNIIWILGGDRPAIHEGRNYIDLWRAMAAGLDEGSGRVDFKTYHPNGGWHTGQWLHAEPWLTMNMLQSGHGGGRDNPVWEAVTHDWHREPAKPTLDGEINYEDHPVNPWPKWDPANGYFRAYDIRKQAYRSVFAGACGVTYGHHFIWQMWDEIHGDVMNNGDEFLPWPIAVNRPGGTQMQHLRALIESRPLFTRVPDQTLLTSDPGEGGEHIRATRDAEGRYAFIYLPSPHPVTVKLDGFAGDTVRTSWFDPRTGDALCLDTLPTSGAQNFTPPPAGPDWVLVLDDTAQNFDPPGQ